MVGLSVRTKWYTAFTNFHAGFCIKGVQGFKKKYNKADRRNGKRSVELAAVMVPKDEIILVACRRTV